ncbi:MAG: ABC transporter substrate-binding protein [Acidimicrobiia bacterium]|nr:MAG: ABC transporter substrate-binding protein [Acidimicrobiia bacterium]
MKRRWLATLGLVMALALVATACGDDDAGTTTTAAETTTTAGGEETTTTAGETTTTAAALAYDTGVTPAPCSDAVNEGNGCIYLGVISDLTDGPFAPLAVPLTQAQEDFWTTINAGGGLDGFDVIISPENTFDAHYRGEDTVQGYLGMRDRVLAMAQVLGTPQTQAALPDIAADETVVMPATWWSGWAFSDVDGGLILESGASYCIEGMNGMSYVADTMGTEISWALVAFPGDYGGDYAAGAKIAAAALGFADPLEILQIPQSAGGDYTETIPVLLAAQPDLIVFVTGPTEMATVIGGLAQAGYMTFKAMGAGPTWNVALTQSPVFPVLEAVFFQTVPWGGWGYDSDGHAALRAAAEASGQSPNGGYIAGWTWQYPMLAVLQQAIADNDLTRANLAAIARSLEGVDYAGMLPDRSYTGSANDNIERNTIINVPDAESPDGSSAVTEFFVSEVAAEYDMSAPCYAPSS